MQQVAQFLSGEHDYVKIAGGTGPLVYPAVHVYIYSGLYWLTDKGRDIKLAQGIFAALYLLTLGGVMACYRRAKVGFTLPDHTSKLCKISPFEAFLTSEIGAALYLPDADPVETITQHLYTEVL